MSDGRLFVCATPIGNLGDVSSRLEETLRAADVVYAEDTRRGAKLLGHVGATAKLRSLFAGNERSRSRELIDDVRSGKLVALVSDAGMPTVSDPGAEAVRLLLAQGLPVTVIPGPSAVTTAIALSGFGGDRFVVEGFLPRRGKERQERVARIASEDRSVVLFASPHRLGEDIGDLCEAIGSDRQIAVTRELTKMHEEVWIGTLGDAVERWGGEVKGEFTLVVEPGSPLAVDAGEAIREARLLVADGASASDAARQVAQSTGVSRRLIYQALLEPADRS